MFDPANDRWVLHSMQGPVVGKGRLEGMAAFLEACDHLTRDALKGDPATRRFVEGQASHIQSSLAGVRLDVLTPNQLGLLK